LETMADVICENLPDNVRRI